jgi:putative ABC transport system ATP-binding protein
MEILKAENISRVYDGGFPVRAVDGLSLRIEKGEFVCIAGPSGSGKTTLLNLLGGLERVDSGAVSVEGKDIGGFSRRQMAELRLRKIGFVFQELNLIPVLTAEENIEYGLLLQGVRSAERRERVAGVMEELGLSGLARRRPHEMSGGQRQRVAVARAVVSRAALVMADEPTANLDSGSSRNLVEMMKKLNREKGMTFVLATHDELILNAAPRVIFLRDGKTVRETKQ